jgi:hypothetical protein
MDGPDSREGLVVIKKLGHWRLIIKSAPKGRALNYQQVQMKHHRSI